MNEITEEDLWDVLYADIAPDLQPGEKTVAMIARDRHVKNATAMECIKKQLEEGNLKYVGDRRIPNGRTFPAYVPVKKK
jgi:hypothetical protein